MEATDRSFAVTDAHMAPHVVLARAEEAPDEVVMEDVEMGRTWTSAELLDAARRWGSALASTGVEAGDRVVTMLTDPGMATISWLGACFAGATEVPINPQHRGELLRSIVTTAAPRTSIVEAALYDEIDENDLAASREVLVVGGPGRSGGVGGARDLDGLLANELTLHVPPAATDLDTAAIIFTSGTTGPSKGVIVPWTTCYQLVSFIPDDAFGPGDAVFCPLPMFHLAGKSTFTNAMVRRARYVYRHRFSASSFLEDVRSAGCTTANVVGPMLSYLNEVPRRSDDTDNPLRAVVCGPMLPDIEAFKERFGVDVVTCYGMTEIGSVLTTTYGHGPWNSCGRVRPTFPWPDIRIVDGDDQDVAPGAVGELVVRAGYPAGFSPGYFDDAAKTAEAWRGGWFHTGDAFRVDDDGNYYLVDRHADTIRRRGENVSSFEIESVVGSHPSVSECAAVAAPGAHGDDDIVVFIIATSDHVDEDALDEWVAARVPSHMRPSRFVTLEDLPRNATSLRVKKYELRDLARNV